MSIQLPQGFKIGSVESIDSRILLTKAEMLAVNENIMPQNYFCICKDDGKLYIWNKAFEKTSELSRFKSYEEILNMAEAINKALEKPETKASLEESISSTLPGAMTEALSDPVKAEALVNAMFENEHFEVSVDNKIDLAVSLIQAIDGNPEE